jgi:hypothetical protein
VSAVPYLLGAQPTDSTLVVLGLRHGRVVTTNCLHLPAPTNLPAEGLPGAWPLFAPHLIARNANAVSIVAYAGSPWTVPLKEFSQAAPLKVVDLIRVELDLVRRRRPIGAARTRKRATRESPPSRG